MNFIMNGRKWKIIELSQEEMRKHIINYKWDGEPKEGKYYGLTYSDEQTIYICSDLCEQQKRQTLMHELMHCYIVSYITHMDQQYTEEDLCDISANSHDIISKIVETYFTKDLKSAGPHSNLPSPLPIHDCALRRLPDPIECINKIGKVLSDKEVVISE